MSRRALEKAIDHTADRHVVSLHDVEANAAMSMRAMASPMRARGPWPGCGWWWCGADLKESQWAELGKAVGILRAKGVDPWGLDLARLVHQCRLDEDAADSKDDYSAILAAIDTLIAQMTTENGRVLVADLKSSQPYRVAAVWAARATELKPRVSHHPADAHLNLALRAGAALGWDPETVAAALYLVGFDLGTFANFRRLITKRAGRLREK